MIQLSCDLVVLLVRLVFMIPEKLYNLNVTLTLTPILQSPDKHIQLETECRRSWL